MASSNPKRRRRQRPERGPNAAKVQKILQPTMNVPYYELLTEEQIEMVHNKSMQIMEEGGIAFIYEPALEIFRKHGLKIEGDVVYFDREFVMETLAKAPSRFEWTARNPEKSIQIGEKYVCFAPVVGPPFVRDLDGGRRDGTRQDLQNFIKMTQVAEYLHCTTQEICVPADIPIAHRHLELFYDHLTLGDKPTMGVYHTGLTGTDSLNMAKIAFGEDAMRDNHYLHCIINVSSPRRLDDRMLSCLIAYAENNQIIDCTPFILSGAMGPVSILGTVAQLNAEALSGILLAQLVNPGNPCIYGSFQAVVDLQSGAPVMGAPESQIALYMNAQLARKYGLPFRAAGSYASSKIIDAQGAYEAALSMFPSLQCGANFVLHAAGWLESGLVAGYEKFVLDHDVLGMFQTFLKGIDWDQDQWAMDEIITEVEPGGHHLGTAHTMRHMKTAFYRSDLFDYEAAENWEIAGAEDSRTRAAKKVKKMLRSYEKPAMRNGMDEELREYIEKRKPELDPSQIVG
ncbi:MAG: trimethylamine methyltransferase family protein [Chloroflexota bacterium]